MFALATVPAAAQATRFRVDLSAPGPLAKLLQSNLDIVRWSKREDVTQGQFEQLVRGAPEQVKQFVATEGYFSPKVTISVDTTGEVQVVHLSVEPGAPAQVSNVDLRFTGPVTRDPDGAARMEEARAAFGLKPGDAFRQALWNEAKERVVHVLARRRYAAARVASSRVQVDPATHSATIELQVDSGPPVTFGELQINGLKRYDRSVVVNLNPIRPGDPYDEDQLIKFQRRLLARGHFASAIVAIPRERQDLQRAPVVVTVIEAASKSLQVGVGVSTDRGPGGQLSYTDYDVFSRAFIWSSEINIDHLTQSVATGLQFPRQESGWRYGLDGAFKNEDIQNQHTTSWSVTGRHTYTVEERESAQALQFLVERSVIDPNPADNRQALFLSQNWSWNTFDDIINPRRGYLALFQIGGASEAVASTRSFGRVYAKISHLQPLGPRWTLGLRAETGLVIADSRDGIPSAYVFRTGGDTTIRGYPYQSLGVTEGNAIVGGRYLAVGSVELTRWITPQWGAAIFYDVGNAFDDLHQFDPVAGYGTGVRWRSPLGNLSLDLAYGEAIHSFRVHFSAGFALQ
jgi:translocation and assembly module TamA